MLHKTAQLYLHNPRHSKHLIEALQEQLTPETSSSSFFVLMELNDNTVEDKNFLQTFLEIAYQGYQDNALHQPEQALENILKNLNEQLPITFKNYDWPRKLNVFAGIMSEKQMYFGLYGKIKTFLIKPLAIKDITGKQSFPEKNIIFDSTYSGDLSSGDRFLITTPSLTDYVSLEKIKKIAGTLPSQSAIAHFNNILENAPARVSFLALLIQLTGDTSQAQTENAKPYIGKLASPTGSKNSMDQLLKTQVQTEKILTPPSIWELTQNYLSIFFKQIKQAKKLPAAGVKTDNLPRRPIARIKTPQKLHSSLKISFKILTFLFRIAAKSFKIIFDKETHQIILKKINGFSITIIGYFKKLPKKYKIAIVSLLAIILILSQSLIWQQQHVANLKANKNAEQIKTQIGEKYNAIDASLIYHDADRSKTLLKEIEALINSYPDNSAKYLTEQIELKKQYDDFFEKIWKLTKITEPLQLVDFQTVLNNQEIKKIALSGNTLYAFGTNNQAASFKTTDNSLTILDKITLEISDAAVNLKNNQLIIASSDNQLYSINGNTLAKISAKMPAELQQIDKLSFFNGRLYLLDKTSQNIFRLIQYGSSFSSPSIWLKTDIDASEIASMAVDGKVILLENNGRVLNLETGSQAEELSLNINPPLESPAVLFANEKTKNMYVLDPQNKRLLVLSKNGDLINQYYSDSFNNLKDLSIDESSGNAYLLNGAKIYVIKIK